MENRNDKRTSFINVAKLLEAYRRLWKWVVVSVLLFLLLGVFVYLRQERKCEVVAQLLISDEGSKSMSSLGEFAGMFGSGSFGANRSVEDEMIIIKAHSVLKKTVQDLDMNVIYRVNKNFVKKEYVYYNQPVKLIYDKSVADTLSIPVVFNINVDKTGLADVTVFGKKNRKIFEKKDLKLPTSIDTPYGAYTLVPGNGSVKGNSIVENITLLSYDAAALMLDKQISVDYSAKKTDIMMLNFIASDARYGKSVLNTLVDNYNNTTIEQKKNFNYKTLQFLEDRIAMLSAEVDSAEAQVEAFMGRRDLVNPQAQANIYIGRTSTQEVELVKAEAEYELLSMAIDFLNNEANNTSLLPIMPSTASLTPLINGYNELILDRLTIESSAKGDNIALKAINTRINAVRDNLLTALGKQAETASVEINEMRRQYARSKSKLGTMPGIEREYANIMRQQSLKEQLYVYLLRQREETEMAIAGAHPRGVIIDEAFVTDSVLGLSPKVILAVFFILGLVLPVAMILVRWNLNGHVLIIDQAIDLSGGESVIAGIPFGEGVQPVVVSAPDSTEARRVRLLRGNILSIESLGKRFSVVVMGCCNDSSASRVAMNLAAAMALTGRRTVLVDANPFDSELEPVTGLSAESMSLESSVNIKLVDSDADIDFVSCGLDVKSGSDCIASVGFESRLKQLSDEYDVVVVCAPSLADHYASVETINNLVDMSLATVEVGKALKKDVRKLSMLNKHDLNAYLVEICS